MLHRLSIFSKTLGAETSIIRQFEFPDNTQRQVVVDVIRARMGTFLADLRERPQWSDGLGA